MAAFCSLFLSSLSDGIITRRKFNVNLSSRSASRLSFLCLMCLQNTKSPFVSTGEEQHALLEINQLPARNYPWQLIRKALVVVCIVLKTHALENGRRRTLFTWWCWIRSWTFPQWYRIRIGNLTWETYLRSTKEVAFQSRRWSILQPIEIEIFANIFHLVDVPFLTLY